MHTPTENVFHLHGAALQMKANEGACELLAGMGVAVTPSGAVVMKDWNKAEKAYIHHSSEPVAAVAYALVSPTFGKGKLPDYLLSDLIRKSGCTDYSEIAAFANLCGCHGIPLERSTRYFCEHLHAVIDRYELGIFFAKGQRRIQYIDVRPTGYEDPKALTAWRKAYMEAPEATKILVASILWLYRGRLDDKHWMNRLPRKWHAVDAVTKLRSAGMLDDWGRLYTLYAGW